MENQKIAANTYKYFSNLDGNQHIASEYALKKIIDIIEKYKIRNVLELGIGIGSISYCVLEFAKVKKRKIIYCGTESNEFCLGVLPQYLKSYFEHIKIFKNIDSIVSSKKFELIIIDGKEENLVKVKDLISNKGIIIIEGDRKPQLELIQSVLPRHKYVRLISNKFNLNYGPCSMYPTFYIGGIQLIFANPSFSQKTNYLFLKILTAIRYKLRPN